MEPLNIDKDWLGQKYIEEQLSTHKIAKIIGCGAKSVAIYLHKYGIPLRNNIDAQKINRTGSYVECSNGCGMVVYRKKSLIEKGTIFFCSWDCEKQYQSKTRKVSSFPEGWRRYKEYRKWRRSVLSRDNNICILCRSQKKLVAHHIFEAKDFPDLAYETDNGVTLCQCCHINVHKLGSKNFIESLQEAILVENPEYRKNAVAVNSEAQKNILEP